MTIRDLVKKDVGIICNCKEDYDRFLKIASQKRWHWLNEASALRWKSPSHYCPGTNPYERVKIRFINVPENKNGVGFGFSYTLIGPGDKSIDWFVENFAPKAKQPEMKEENNGRVMILGSKESLKVAEDLLGKGFVSFLKKITSRYGM